jgi:hypothetical protein
MPEPGETTQVERALKRLRGDACARLLTPWCAAMLLMLASGAMAEPPPTGVLGAAPPTDQAQSKNARNLPQVTIEAQRESIERRAYAFVRRIAHSARFYDESLERWDLPICFLVAGLPEIQGEFVLGRLSQIAASVGAPLAGQHCTPNFYVLVTSEPDSLMQGLRARDPFIFGKSEMPEMLRRFLKTPRPVRVWYNIEFSRGDRKNSSSSGETTRGGAPRINPDINVNSEASRLVRYDVLQFLSVIVIVDTNRAKTPLKFGQIADYIAMVGLTEIDPDADFGSTPTILRLFNSSPEAPPSALTNWDRAFLKALYNSDQSSQVQRSQIALRIATDVSQSSAPAQAH